MVIEFDYEYVEFVHSCFQKNCQKKSVKVRMITQRGIGNSFQFLDLRISGKSEKTLLYGQGIAGLMNYYFNH